MLGYGSMEAESESEPVGESVGVVFAQACAPSRPRGVPERRNKIIGTEQLRHRIRLPSQETTASTKPERSSTSIATPPSSPLLSASSPRGPRQKDGITFKPQPGSISFHVLNDMFRPGLRTIKPSSGVRSFRNPIPHYRTRPTPRGLQKPFGGMVAPVSGMRRTGQKEHIRGGTSGKTRERETMTMDCKVRFLAYAKISKPIYGGGSGTILM